MQQIAADKHEYTDYRRRGVTLRILLISLIVAPVNAYFMADLHRRGIEDPTVVSLFWNCLFMLVIFRLINSVFLRWAPRFAFSPAELLAFFILISVATCASGLDTLKTSIATMQGYAYFASPENHYEDLFGTYVPESMTVSDLPALERLWKGDSSIWDPRNWKVWGPPVLRWWALFTFIVNLVLLGIDITLFGNTTVEAGNFTAYTNFSPLTGIFSLLVFLPSLSVAVRRLHDTDRSGWWWWLLLIPLVGFIVLIVFWASIGTRGPNRFGADPLGPG